MRARSQSSSTIDTLHNNSIFYFNFTASNLHFYLHSSIQTHSLSCMCVRTLTPQTLQCVLNKFASTSWITFIIYWRERRNNKIFSSLRRVRTVQKWMKVCIWLRASERATFIENKVKHGRCSCCCPIGDGLRGQYDRTKEMQKNRKYFIKYKFSVRSVQHTIFAAYFICTCVFLLIPLASSLFRSQISR